MIRTEPVPWDRNTQVRSATTYSVDPIIALAFLTKNTELEVPPYEGTNR
jgi:hypothetical protein